MSKLPSLCNPTIIKAYVELKVETRGWRTYIAYVVKSNLGSLEEEQCHASDQDIYVERWYEYDGQMAPLFDCALSIFFLLRQGQYFFQGLDDVLPNKMIIFFYSLCFVSHVTFSYQRERDSTLRAWSIYIWWNGMEWYGMLHTPSVGAAVVCGWCGS